jgi:hypothetical protein
METVFTTELKIKEDLDGYVKPPIYKETKEIDTLLFTKLKLRIHKDLNQINGVYDCQVSESELEKNKLINKIKLEYQIIEKALNKDRKDEIASYNKQAEKYIDTLLSSMNKSPVYEESGWFDFLWKS